MKCRTGSVREEYVRRLATEGRVVLRNTSGLGELTAHGGGA